jgi:hypothetical protein
MPRIARPPAGERAYPAKYSAKTYGYPAAAPDGLNRQACHTGWIVMNDYIISNIAGTRFTHCGVDHGTHESMIAENRELMYLALYPKMHCDTVLRGVR